MALPRAARESGTVGETSTNRVGMNASVSRRDRKGQRAAPAYSGTIPEPELQRLLGLRHHNPHAWLGQHPTAQGVVLRAMRPDAAQVDVVFADGTTVPLARTHAAGLF